jgi:hypothetical protein
MSNVHRPTDDIVYDVVSIQYHALKAGEAYDKYLKDVHDHEDVAEFIRQCQSEDEARALRAHELIRELMRGHHEDED